MSSVPGSLCSAQRSVYFDQLLNPDQASYHVGMQMQVPASLKTEYLLQALAHVLEKHPLLRSQLVNQKAGQGDAQAEDIQQQIIEHCKPPLLTLNLQDGKGDPETKQARMREAVEQPFNLHQAPCWRVVHVTGNNGESEKDTLMLVVHHLFVDGLSFPRILTDITTFYETIRRNNTPIYDVNHAYTDHIEEEKGYLQSAKYQKDRAFWQEQMAVESESVFNLPVASPVLPNQRTSEFQRFTLTRSLVSKMQTIAESYRTSMSTVLNALAVSYFSRMNGVSSVAVGVSLHNRTKAKYRSAVGMFSAFKPLNLDVAPEMTFISLMQQIDKKMKQLLRHQRFPTSELHHMKGVKGTGAENRLFDISVSYENFTHEPFCLEGEVCTQLQRIEECYQQFPLAIMLCDYDEFADPVLILNTNLSWVDELLQQHLGERLIAGLYGLCDGFDIAIKDVPFIPETEYRYLLEELNQTQPQNHNDYPQDKCIHELFEAQVETNPEAIALVQDGMEITYANLNKQSNQLADLLIKQGVKLDSLVGLCVERKPYMIVALLAILKAGGAYVPLDPAYASSRLRDIVSDAQPLLLLADSEGLDVLGDAANQQPVIQLDTDWQTDELSKTNPQVQDLTPQHLAYVIYTSGSTGKPKGVMTAHESVVNLVSNNGYLDFEQGYHIALSSTFAFDAFTMEIWGALLHGGCGVLIDKSVLMEPAALTVQLKASNVEVLWLTASYFDQIVPQLTNMSLRYLLVGGDRLTPASVNLFIDNNPKVRLLNGYGPTETTTFATVCDVTQLIQDSRQSSRQDRAEPLRDIPIGRPIANTQTYILDAHQQLIPQGEMGELYVGGSGIARGYLNQTALTQERFIASPFIDGDRLYRTGDLVRYLPDGNIAFLGRNDFQVKIRGFRIELGEIEARLSEVETVQASTVLIIGEGDAKQLVAYVIPENKTVLEDETPEQESQKAEFISNLRSKLSSELPDYMVPAAFMLLDNLPLTPNGKLDRKALPAVDSSAFVKAQYEAPKGEVEQKLAEVWSSILGVERISRHDDFFSLGGNSLISVRLINQLREHDINLSVKDLFAHPTIIDLAKQTQQTQTAIEIPENQITEETTVITPDMLPLIELPQQNIDQIIEHVPGGVSNVQDIYALSPLQQGLLFHHTLNDTLDPYLLHTQLVINSPVELEQFISAVQQVVNRHDVFRTHILWRGMSEPAQVVLRNIPVNMSTVVLDEGADSSAKDYLNQMQATHGYLDIENESPLRFITATLPGSEQQLVLMQLHHIAGDHTSLERLVHEVALLSAAKTDQSKPAQLMPSMPYRNLIAHIQATHSPQAQGEFFTEMLSDITESTAPFGLTDVQMDGSESVEVQVTLPDTLNQKLRQQSKLLGVSVASLCHLAYGAVIARASGTTTPIFGTVLLGRMDAIDGTSTAADAMGLFINTLPYRQNINDVSVQAAVKRAHRDLINLMDFEHASLADVQACSGIEGKAPLFSAMLNYRHNANSDGMFTNSSLLQNIEILAAKERVNYPIVMSVEDNDSSLGLTAQVTVNESAASGQDLCNMLQRALEHLAQLLEKSPHTPVSKLHALSDEQHHYLVETLNQTQTNYPQDTCIHELFEAQVEANPDAIALVFDNEKLTYSELTYSELNRQANQLAHLLIEQGVKPDSLVGLCAERKPYTIIAMLAILKAGGAYVPLDPAYASSRLQDILSDAQPILLLVDSEGLNVLGDSAQQQPIIQLDSNWQTDELSEHNPQVPGLTPQHLAYVIYTSGSTGKPKGVMVEHGNVARLFYTSESLYGFNQQDVWTLFHSYGFDFSVWEIWGALAYGGRLVLVPGEIARDSEAFYAFLCEQRVTVLNQTPSAFYPLISAKASSSQEHCLRYIIFGGEALDVSRLAGWAGRKEERSETSVHSTLVNMYGITETTVHVTHHVITPEDIQRGGSPIGKPLPDLSAYLLDSHQQPVPMGVVGELYIGGGGVTRGYLNRAELTQERFIANPFKQGERLYRTGDLAKWQTDGTLAYAGRNDFQVKIRGFRIELGEIEAKLNNAPSVQSCTVLAIGEGDAKQLVAYLIPEDKAVLSDDEQKAELISELRSKLSGELPDYMLPSAFMLLESWPLTPNGKLDTKALPAIDDKVKQSKNWLNYGRRCWMLKK